jgi:hypothetical protein
MALRISGDAQNIDVLLRDHASKDNKRYAYLEKIAVNRKKEIPITKSSRSSWTAKIEQMRKEHPNAYRPWESMQDAELKEKFLNGATVEELSKTLGRHEGSIRSRLQKHFGEDIVQ